jgi:hypothetical protein
MLQIETIPNLNITEFPVMENMPGLGSLELSYLSVSLGLNPIVIICS